MSEYSRWRERRSTALTAKPTAKPTAAHAKCRQGHANDYARAHQVRRTRRATHRLLAHVRQVHRLCRAEPPRPAARREPPRLVSWWHARRLNARARQAAPCAAATPPPRRASHRLPGVPHSPASRALPLDPGVLDLTVTSAARATKRWLRRPCRAEPPRQAARRRLHARARQVPRHAMPTQRPRTPSSRAPPPTPSQPSTPGTRTPSAPPVPSRAAKTGGTPPTQRPPSVSLAKYGGQRNSQQVSAPARDECQPTSAENGAVESTRN
jgi:hypothetical protein